MKMKLLICMSFCLFLLSCATTPKRIGYHAIHSGVAWFDQYDNEVNAHGACIVKEGDRYYLFGEYKSDTTNAFSGFGCYSSADLMNWQFEKVVLPVQADGLLGPSRVGERVKVMKCPSTGEYVMYMHTDDMRYMDPHVGYATCSTINGDYRFEGGLLYEDECIRKWDLGTFQDTDGKGYLLTHEGNIYALADDYKSVERIVVSDEARGGESPAMFKKNGVYFWLFSNKTSWERNDNYYLTSNALQGPWNRRGYFAPEGSLTWNSQCSFVFPVANGNDTLHMYMGDRWSFPKQASAGTQVWLPVTVKDDDILSLPEFYPAWRLNASHKAGWQTVETTSTSIQNSGVQEHGHWETKAGVRRSNEQGSTLSYTFQGQQVGILAQMDNASGYAKITIRNQEGYELISTIADFYSLHACTSSNFLSPVFEPGRYTLVIEVLGEHPQWSDKRKTDYGSTDNYIQIADVLLYN